MFICTDEVHIPYYFKFYDKGICVWIVYLANISISVSEANSKNRMRGGGKPTKYY